MFEKQEIYLGAAEPGGAPRQTVPPGGNFYPAPPGVHSLLTLIVQNGWARAAFRWSNANSLCGTGPHVFAETPSARGIAVRRNLFAAQRARGGGAAGRQCQRAGGADFGRAGAPGRRRFDFAQPRQYDARQKILEHLDKIRLGLLSGGIPRQTLQRLAAELNAARAETADPRLRAILDEIELRVRVEIATYDSGA